MKRLLIPALLSLLALGSFGAAGEKTCAEKCADANRQRIGVCDSFYPPKSQLEKHRQCLDNAKSKFDVCIADCK